MAAAIPMTGGFSGYVPLSNAVMPSYAVAERNLFPKNGDSGLKVHAGRPIAQPQRTEGGISGGTGGPEPTANTTPIGDRKARLRAKYAEQLAQGMMEEGASTKPTVGSGWSPIVQGLSRAAMGGLGGLIARRGERLQQEGEDASAKAFNALFTEGQTPTTAQLAAFGNDPYANKFQQGVVADMLGNRLNPKKNLLVVGKRLYNADTGEWVDGGPGGAGAAAPDIDDVVKLQNQWENSAGIKAYNTIVPSLNSVYKSLNDNSIQANNDFLYGAAKVFDPMTGVRDAEREAILGGMSPKQWLEMWAGSIAQGKGIPLEVKENIYRVMRRRAGEVFAQANAEAKHFYKIAPQLGVGTEYMPPLMQLPPELPEFTVE